MRLAWRAFNGIHGITIDGANCDLGDNCWDTGDFVINVSYGLTNLEGGYGRERRSFVLIIHLGHETDIRWGEIVLFMFIFFVKRTS